MLVLGLLAGHSDTLVCEQAAAHLHPDAGPRLHAFYDALCRDGVRVVLETNDRDLLEHVRERVDVAERNARGGPPWDSPP